MILKFLFILILTWQGVYAQKTSKVSANENPPPVLWPDKIWSDLTKEVDRSGSQITNVIFDIIDDNSIDILGANNIKLNGVVQRRVFDNQDLLGTWTVSDSFGLDLTRDAVDLSIPLIPNVVSPVNFSFGVGGRLMVTHVRQVAAKIYPDLPNIKEVEGLLGTQQGQEKDESHNFDQSFRARFGKLWNTILAVTKIPVSRASLKKLKDGEIVSYLGSGYVSVGLETGFLPLNVIRKKLDITLGLGGQVYLKGEYRITLLKEDSRFVRVKLTKINSLGTGFAVGAKTNEIEVYEGFTAFGDNVGKTKVTLIPFKISLEKEKKNQLDIGYRFDLDDPEALAAFEKSLVGNFSHAETLSKTNPKIELILDRTSKTKKVIKSLVVGADWVIKGARKSELKNTWITLEQPSSKKEIFISSLELIRAWSTVFGSGENKRYIFSSILDQAAYQNGDENGFQIISEAFIEDVNTSGEEMLDYTRNIESVIGKDDIFPEIPVFVPGKNNKMKIAEYKRSSFYFGHYLSQKQVMRFINTDAETALDIVLKAFPSDSKLGMKFYRKWMQLKDDFHHSMSKDEMVQGVMEIQKIFRPYRSSVNVMRAILLSLNGEEVDYFLTATNHFFGRIQFRGRVTSNAEKLIRIADETLGFENRVGSVYPNPDALIKEFSVGQSSDSSIKITFDLPKNSNYLFFRVLRTSSLKRVKKMDELVFHNKGRFKEGLNTWIIKPDSADPLDSEIYKAFRETAYYTLQVSASSDRLIWGRVESSRFRFVEIPVSEQTNPPESEEDEFEKRDGF